MWNASFLGACKVSFRLRYVVPREIHRDSDKNFSFFVAFFVNFRRYGFVVHRGDSLYRGNTILESSESISPKTHGSRSRVAYTPRPARYGPTCCVDIISCVLLSLICTSCFSLQIYLYIRTSVGVCWPVLASKSPSRGHVGVIYRVREVWRP